MNIDEQKCYQLLEGVVLPVHARVLASWRSEKLESLLRSAVPDISIDYLMDMDVETFMQIPAWTEDGRYDFIFDNGLLGELAMDSALLRALGMQLKNEGAIRSVLPASIDKRFAGHCSYVNNFDKSILVNWVEAGADTFYIAEFSCFQRKVTWLQSFYTPDIRRELTFLLQRIDFDIMPEENAVRVQRFVEKHNINVEYLRLFLDTAVIYKEKVQQYLQMPVRGEQITASLSRGR